MNSNKLVLEMKPVNCAKSEDAYKGHVFTNPDTYSRFLSANAGEMPVQILVNGFVYHLN
jgi:hypothetical protein